MSMSADDTFSMRWWWRWSRWLLPFAPGYHYGLI